MCLMKAGAPKKQTKSNFNKKIFNKTETVNDSTVGRYNKLFMRVI
jgi:hypothetical protein